MSIVQGVAPTCSIVIGNVQIRQANKFKYLRSKLTEDGIYESEIKKRIGITRSAFIKYDIIKREVPQLLAIGCIHILVIVLSIKLQTVQIISLKKIGSQLTPLIL